ncbi:MAG: MlaD family protein [bacterium]
MDKKNLELSVGITSIIGIVLLILGSLWGKDIGFTSKHRKLVFSFENSGGLRPGDPVAVNGVKKGRVDEIVLRQNQVLVSVLLDENVALNSDAKAKIAMVDLMGGNKLEISPGTSGNPLAKGTLEDPITGARVVSLGEMFVEAFKLKPKVDTLLISLQGVVDEMALLIAKDKMRNPLHQSLANLSNISDEMRNLLSETKPKLQKTLDHVQQSSKNMDTLFSYNQESFQNSIERFASITAKLDTMTTAMNDIMAVLLAREGTVAKLIYEDEVYNRLQHTVNGVDSLTIELRKNLGKYLKGVDIKLLNLIDF